MQKYNSINIWTFKIVDVYLFKQNVMTTSIFSEFATSNNLDSAELDDIVNKAFDALKTKYQQFEMVYDESGVIILNFDDCTNEETGGWTKTEIENDLTDELLKQANSSLNN